MVKTKSKSRSLILIIFSLLLLFNPINRDKTFHDDSARVPPISHKCFIYLLPSYDAGLTWTKMLINVFQSETKSIAQVRNACCLRPWA